MKSTVTIAPRLVSWLLLLFGLAEVPWVIYLVFNQDPTVAAFHVRLLTLGLGAGVAIATVGAAWAVWRGSRAAAVWCVVAATTMLFLATVVSLSSNLQADGLLGSWVPLALAIPGAVAAGVAARHLLASEGDAASTTLRIAALVLAVVGAIFVVRTGLHLASAETTAEAERMRAVVVILDTAESVGLIGAGVASLRGLRRTTLVFATMAATLLVIDAYANVVAAEPGSAFVAALFYLVVGEIPSIVLSVIAARSALRALTSTSVSGGSRAGSESPGSVT